MPYYEFECTECKRIFNVIVGLNVFDGQQLRCPLCGSRRLELLIDSDRRARSQPNQNTMASTID